MRILVINSGSSSIKYKIFDLPNKEFISKGTIENIGEPGSKFKDHYSGLKSILEQVDHIEAVGHRVLHGAEAFKAPVVVNDAVVKKIRQCFEMGPLHNPANLAGILACKKLLPGIKQVAIFDTEFHQTLPDYAYIYGVPYSLYEKYGVRKYGFHGTSHQYVSQEAARLLKKPITSLRLITCHLGNGCSIAAVDKGRCIDTSMGFTPLEGLLMGTRSGDIDPALVLYIMRKEKLSPEQMDTLLNKQSGLKGLSGISNDMRILDEKRSRGDKRATLALNVFIYRIKKYIGAYSAIMGGCEAVIFTAGIGENQKNVREEICTGIFDHLKKKPKVMVIPTNEELMIALQTYKLMLGKSK